MENMTISHLIALIVSMMTKINNSTFIGLTYTNRNGEKAKHVLIADASYYEACNTAIEILKGITTEIFSRIAEKYKVGNVGGIQYATNEGARVYLECGKLPKEGTKARENVLKGVRVTKTLSEIRDEMINTIIKNRDEKTRSAKSQQEIDDYEYVERGLKVNRKTGMVVIFAKAHSKVKLIEGVYEESEKELETLQKEAISKFCKYELGTELPNELFRKFNVTTDQLHRVKVMGTELVCE